MSRNGVLLQVEGVSKSFGALAALTDVSLTVSAGEVVSVIGPNGAGKSTLFNVITGLHGATRGRVLFDGQVITGRAPESVNRLGLAKTFQITNVFPGISVYENVRVAAQSRTPFGLEGRRDEAAQNLSHGEQRYLEICLALATKPTLLLLDEPTAGMTPGETRDATALIRRMALARGLTLLLIEHDMSVVMGISDRVAVLHFGQKIAEGPPEAIRTNPQVIDAYLGGVDD